MATHAQRTHLHHLMVYMLNKERQIHYRQARPMQTLHYSEQQVTQLLDHGGSISLDCSEFVTCLCKWAGLHDPTGFHFNGYGNTSSMFAHLPHYTDPKHALTGAIIVFGAGGYHHTVMVKEPDPRHGNPIVCGHGREAGPIAEPLSHQIAAQPAPTTFLSIARL